MTIYIFNTIIEDGIPATSVMPFLLYFHASSLDDARKMLRAELIKGHADFDEEKDGAILDADIQKMDFRIVQFDYASAGVIQ